MDKETGGGRVEIGNYCGGDSGKELVTEILI